MKLDIQPIYHIPEIGHGMDLSRLLIDGITASGLTAQQMDVVAVTQKVISKAEGLVVKLSEIEPSQNARAIARQAQKDPRLIEVILRESKRLVRIRGDVLICETHHGFICANAGVDRSNVEGGGTVTVLPRDPDRSARRLARVLGCGVIITDTFGRPWREGLVDVAIGIARVPPFVDFRGDVDTKGYELHATRLAAVDALAAAAGLVMGKVSNTPAALIRGFSWVDTESRTSALLRDSERDLFL
jgi:coenzyme F420-0:L-glutamate ligase/coenzyme F420-1:gamma-L-glutamate ligase